MKRVVLLLFLFAGSITLSVEGYPVPDKLCALTFDDGPDPKLTTKVLDALERHNVVATFFLVGKLVNERTRSVLERMVKMGCEVGNHSWDYNSLDKMEPERIREYVERTNKVIEEYTGQVPVFFRPPNLAVSRTMFDAIDMPFVGGVLGYDWAGCDRTPEKIAENVLKGVRDGAIILLHDVQPEPHPIVEALEIIIPELKKMGYEFVTLSELFRRKGIDPKDPKYKYRVWMYVQ